MSETPVDPMDDPANHGAAPQNQDAIDAAEQMNDPDGPQPGVSENPPAPRDDEPLPDVPGAPG